MNERGTKALPFRISLGVAHQQTNSPHAPRLLRARRERPRGRGAEERDELAASNHSITSSADHLVSPQSLWQATNHEHNACPVGNAQANAPEVFSVEPEDFPAAKHMCESSVDRESKCPISSRQHYCNGLERKVVRKQRKVPQTLSLRSGE